jgi:hypothetical protein
MLPWRTNKSGQRQNNRYAAPDVPVGSYLSSGVPGEPSYVNDVTATESGGYHNSPTGAWAPGLTQQPGGYPDPHRTQQLDTKDYRPTPLTSAPERWWLGPKGPGAEEQGRHTAIEHVDADGWTMQRPVWGAKRAAPDPRRTPPPETRLTQSMSPSRYWFTRPFDQHAARRLNGLHFSMADHRRDYPIMGMQPVTARRNTYRLDPPPHDIDIVDEPAVSSFDTTPNQRLQQVELPLSSNRSWRLG